jgi:hypothetical protein
VVESGSIDLGKKILMLKSHSMVEDVDGWQYLGSGFKRI